MKSFWLVKQEPSSYSWSDFVAEGQTSWTGVRNYAARNNLRKMRKGDEVLASVKPLRRPVTLREIKSNPRLTEIALVRQSRLSVMALAESEFREILKIATT
ncbi:MAG: EVE domain-containing protein [Verrucomicrobia bacterium]|nr:MAG: EVE domain-containing protein [Verrucomicrobiota bacterium]